MATKYLEHIAPPVIEGVRLTVPAREALERAGNTVAEIRRSWQMIDPEIRPEHPLPPSMRPPMTGGLYDVTMRQPPGGIELVLIGNGDEQHHGLRLADEPEYPGEWPRGKGIAWCDRGYLVPCPSCGAALVWCEAGFVPGWRICLRGHANQLSDDGRSAERHPESDESTLRATRPL